MTTMQKKDNRKAALAQIHIAKSQLGLDDDTYRQMLKNLTGKRSCSDMVIGELYIVIRHLENVGFKKHRPRRGQYSPRSTGKVIDVMRAIWIEMHKAGFVKDGSELALTRWAKRASSQRNGGIGVESLEWLEKDTRLAIQVLEDLKQWQKRAAKKQEVSHVN